MRWLANFIISGSNEQLQQQLEYTVLKPDCHSWWISKMQSDKFEEWYAIKLCYKLGKMLEKRMECFRLLFDHLAWIEHQFLSGIRDPRKAGSLWGMMRGVGGVRKSLHHSWLAKGLGLGLLFWGFKGFQEELPSEEPSTFQIRSVAFPPGRYTSPPLHPCHRLFDKKWASLQFLTFVIVQTLFLWFCLFPNLRGCRYETIEDMKVAETNVIDTLTQEDFHGPTRSCWNGTTRALQPEETTSKGTWVSCVYYQ